MYTQLPLNFQIGFLYKECSLYICYKECSIDILLRAKTRTSQRDAVGGAIYSPVATVLKVQCNKFHHAPYILKTDHHVTSAIAIFKRCMVSSFSRNVATR